MTLWIVGQSKEDAGTIGTSRWEFQGVFRTEQEAIDACVNDYFIGPAILGQRLEDERVPWPGSYYPRLEAKPQP